MIIQLMSRRTPNSYNDFLALIIIWATSKKGCRLNSEGVRVSSRNDHEDLFFYLTTLLARSILLK